MVGICFLANGILIYEPSAYSYSITGDEESNTNTQMSDASVRRALGGSQGFGQAFEHKLLI